MATLDGSTPDATTPALNAVRIIVSIAATLSLAVTFVAAGFVVCCLPQTTEALAGLFSGSENPDTPFSHDDLVHAAVATRDYTVGSNDRDAVFAMLHDINANAGTRLADASEEELAAAPEEYTLPSDALSHLDDVYEVVAAARGGLLAVAVVALATCVFLGLRAPRRWLGGALLVSGACVIAAFALLAAWVLIDFNGFFAAFHSLFFANGTWTFSWDSLLITMYPPEFWMGMGAVWLAVTACLSILSLIAGIRLRRSGQEHRYRNSI